MSYQTLYEQSNQLAHYLQSKGVQKGDIIAVLMSRSPKVIITFIAIMKAGACYLPIDPSHPKSRQEHLIADSNTTFLIQESTNTDRPMISTLSYADPQKSSFPTTPINHHTSPQDRLYILYTSGSTGTPKRIAIQHQQAQNLSIGFNRVLSATEQSPILAISNYCFDISYTELIHPLTLGNTIVMANDQEKNHPQKIQRLIQNHHIKCLQITPSQAQQSLSIFNKNTSPSLQHVFLTAEPLCPNLAKTLANALPHCHLYNAYGLTETCIWSSISKISPKHPISIGTPMANTRLYCLDEQLNPRPFHCIGDIWISGIGVSKETSTGDIVPDPFYPKYMMYRSGDKGYWGMDHRLYFSGRNDQQLTHFGHRINAIEIKNNLTKHPNIESCDIVIHHITQALTAFFIPSQAPSPNQSELNTFLSERLPYYMIPSQYIEMSALPVTPHQKRDLKALETYPIDPTHLSFTTQSNLSTQLTQLFEKHLSIPITDTQASFFDLGCHSIMLTQIHQDIQSQWKIEFPLLHLFEAPNIDLLSNLLQPLIPKKDPGSKAPIIQYESL
ncbi:MAG: hypothetical protein CL521_01235 [Actinobacteria bacterium]|nr:hypothetical protein [Actinomycetota bacterium]